MAKKQSKKIEEFLNIKPMEDLPEKTEKPMEDLPEKTEKPMEDLPEKEEISKEMKAVDLESNVIHGKEMDDINEKAIDAYEEIMGKTLDIAAKDMASLYNAAATMLKIAADAKNSKANVNLKTVDLLIKKQKAALESGDQMSLIEQDTSESFTGNRADLVKKLKDDK